MLLGLATYAGFHGKLDNFLEFAHQLGMEYIEILAEKPFFSQDLSRKETTNIRRLLKKLSLTPIVHLPYIDINLSSLNPLIREASVKQTKRCLIWAREIGASWCVLHCGNVPHDYAPYKEEGLRSLKESLIELISESERLNLLMALENKQKSKNFELLRFPEDHLNLLKTFNSPFLKVVLDIGHAHTFGLDIVEYLRKVAPYLIEIHLHDNFGEEDEHLPLGKGSINYLNFLETWSKLSKKMPLILEMKSFSDIKECLPRLNKFLRR